LKVILSGSDYEDHWQRREPFDVQIYSENKAWPTQRNVYYITEEQYYRWVMAREEYKKMQAEIRDTIRDRPTFWQASFDDLQDD
jgi:hypothetical protein